MRVLLALITVGITIYAFVDCLRSGNDEVRALPRPLWLLITLIPLAGGLVWLALGRPVSGVPGVAGGGGPQAFPRVVRPVAPDDDPDFLQSLDRTFREQRRQAAEEARRRRRAEDARRQAERDADNGKPRPGGTAGPDDEPGARQTPA